MRHEHPPAGTVVAEPVCVGDHIALDFINTSYGVGEGAREGFRSDADVAGWLRSMSLPADSSDCRPGELLRSALELRRVALDLIEKRTAGVAGNPRDLNRLLGAGCAYDELRWPRGGLPMLTVRERLQGVDGLLLPVGRAVAELLSGPDFALVRRCEGRDCTLWFWTGPGPTAGAGAARRCAGIERRCRHSELETNRPDEVNRHAAASNSRSRL